MNGHNFPGGQGDAGAVGQGGGVLNLDGMRLSINYFPNISLASRFYIVNIWIFVIIKPLAAGMSFFP